MILLSPHCPPTHFLVSFACHTFLCLLAGLLNREALSAKTPKTLALERGSSSPPQDETAKMARGREGLATSCVCRSPLSLSSCQIFLFELKLGSFWRRPMNRQMPPRPTRPLTSWTRSWSGRGCCRGRRPRWITPVRYSDLQPSLSHLATPQKRHSCIEKGRYLPLS